MTQTCRVCDQEKPLDDFTFRKDSGKHRTDCNQCRSLASQAQRYGLDREELIGLLVDACCEVCGEGSIPHATFIHTGGLVIDHDHSTGEVRGVLCTNCNIAAGQLQDDPARALALAKYLTD